MAKGPDNSALLSWSSASGMYGVHTNLWCSHSVLAGRLICSFTEYLDTMLRFDRFKKKIHETILKGHCPTIKYTTELDKKIL